MKTLQFLAFFTFTILFFSSCSDENTTETPVNEELSEAAKQVLNLKFGSLRASDNAMGAVNMSFQNMMAEGRKNGKVACDSSENGGGDHDGDTTWVEEDTVIYEDPWYWTSCATVTTTYGEDGTTTTVTDYGDGCEEGYESYKYWMQGKYISTYKGTFDYTETEYTDSYSYSNIYENYGGKYYANQEYGTEEYTWSMNGSDRYTGTSTANWETGVYSGSYTSFFDYVYSWNEMNYDYEGNSSVTYDQNKYTISTSKYAYVSNDGYSYDYEVIVPLVWDNTCNATILNEGDSTSYTEYVWTYISGIEKVKYNYNGEEGNLEINYGDGTCDNIITVTENGVSTEVDLGTNWYAEVNKED